MTTTPTLKTATEVRKLSGWDGDARLYRISEGEPAFVVASSVDSGYASETMVFACDENGGNADYMDLGVAACGDFAGALLAAGFHPCQPERRAGMTTITESKSQAALDSIEATSLGLIALRLWMDAHPDTRVIDQQDSMPTRFLVSYDHEIGRTCQAIALAESHGDVTRQTYENTVHVTGHFGGGVTLTVVVFADGLGEKVTRTVEIDDWVLPAGLAAIPEAVTA